ncbi:Hemolysin activation/secretion protein associated with VreARI signaling system [Lysobacter capsici AZ78]|uniref:Hemolysin activation/secretion protein associated with VreARI signaling system n=1 Tax=Lysobacter capsici AZ78 TaxID=1444315 RepID=A0A108U5Q9_9GAMM|nr:ShlB/FhaC/HecB family hemolysin secretion/activation protein [Lysobacter capsici]KWS03040.1 Hemolysin activation/secretion protein associated with VreARI signaling system [Lysobacter capsici AZ78]
MSLRLIAAVGLSLLGPARLHAQETSTTAPAAAPIARFDVMAYQVLGNSQLSNLDIEKAVYPHLGPQRSEQDVEAARAALQALYDHKGFPTVSVVIPEQDASTGLVTLQVNEQKVGRLRVNGAEYFSPDDIERAAPSLAQGEVPNFKDVQRDIVALNQWPDRRVTPEIKAGATPNTVDVDLNVEDSLPLHGSLELNNRNSANTTEQRLAASLRYDNLWQRGHSVSLSAQLAPQRREDAEVFSVSYLARFGASPYSLLGYAVRSKSDIAVVGDLNVIGNGTLAGLRLMRSFATREGFFHSLSLGLDYKDFNENLVQGADRGSVPIEYLPISVNYNADWVKERSVSDLALSAVFNLRGVGDGRAAFDAKRYQAQPNFFYLRASGSHTWKYSNDAQLMLRLQSQFAGEPLISNEQFSIGGLDSVRGYYESESLGDLGAAATLEARTPSFSDSLGDAFQELRLRAFVDAGYARINDPLPDQLRSETLVSAGVGASLKAFGHFNGSVDVAKPLSSPNGRDRKPDGVEVGVRLWGEF